MINLLIELVVLGLVFYCIGLLPLASPFPQIIRVVAIIIAIVLLLGFIGISVPLHV